MEDKGYYNILNFKCLSATLAYMELFKPKIETQFIVKEETSIYEEACASPTNTQIGAYNQHQIHGELSGKVCIHRLLQNDLERKFLSFFDILKNNLKKKILLWIYSE